MDLGTVAASSTAGHVKCNPPGSPPHSLTPPPQVVSVVGMSVGFGVFRGVWTSASAKDANALGAWFLIPIFQVRAKAVCAWCVATAWCACWGAGLHALCLPYGASLVTSWPVHFAHHKLPSHPCRASSALPW